MHNTVRQCSSVYHKYENALWWVSERWTNKKWDMSYKHFINMKNINFIFINWLSLYSRILWRVIYLCKCHGPSSKENRNNPTFAKIKIEQIQFVSITVTLKLLTVQYLLYIYHCYNLLSYKILLNSINYFFLCVHDPFLKKNTTVRHIPNFF